MIIIFKNNLHIDPKVLRIAWYRVIWNTAKYNNWQSCSYFLQIATFFPMDKMKSSKTQEGNKSQHTQETQQDSVYSGAYKIQNTFYK